MTEAIDKAVWRQLTFNQLDSMLVDAGIFRQLYCQMRRKNVHIIILLGGISIRVCDIFNAASRPARVGCIVGSRVFKTATCMTNVKEFLCKVNSAHSCLLRSSKCLAVANLPAKIVFLWVKLSILT